MAVTENTTTTKQITVKAKEIDLAQRFTQTWDALREIMGIMRPIRKTPGTTLVSSKATITLQSGTVAEGDEVPLSQATVTPVAYKDLTLQKYRKRVTAEAVDKFGAAIAVQKTDDALLNELQSNVLNEFYTFALTGTLTGTEKTFQMAVAMSIGRVKDKFKKLRLNYGNVVVFANTLDVHRYLGSTTITTQTSNGVEYLKNFLGADTVIVSSEIPEGKVLAVPVDNIVLYYCDPSDSDFAELGLEYTTGAGETNLIGVHKEGVYGRASGDTHVLMGMAMWAEYLDAIAVTTINAGE
nr:MAG TPA: major capsid protein [Caudoviricetes sp.]